MRSSRSDIRSEPQPNGRFTKTSRRSVGEMLEWTVAAASASLVVPWCISRQNINVRVDRPTGEGGGGGGEPPQLCLMINTPAGVWLMTHSPRIPPTAPPCSPTLHFIVPSWLAQWNQRIERLSSTVNPVITLRWALCNPPPPDLFSRRVPTRPFSMTSQTGGCCESALEVFTPLS